MNDRFKVVVVANGAIWMGGFATIEAATGICNALRGSASAESVYLVNDIMDNNLDKERIEVIK